MEIQLVPWRYRWYHGDTGGTMEIQLVPWRYIWYHGDTSGTSGTMEIQVVHLRFK